MADYTFYKPSGEITVILSCPPEELSLNLRPGESHIEGRFSAWAYEVRDGVAIPSTRFNPLKQAQNGA